MSKPACVCMCVCVCVKGERNKVINLDTTQQSQSSLRFSLFGIEAFAEFSRCFPQISTELSLKRNKTEEKQKKNRRRRKNKTSQVSEKTASEKLKKAEKVHCAHFHQGSGQLDAAWGKKLALHRHIKQNTRQRHRTKSTARRSARQAHAHQRRGRARPRRPCTLCMSRCFDTSQDFGWLGDTLQASWLGQLQFSLGRQRATVAVSQCLPSN